MTVVNIREVGKSNGDWEVEWGGSLKCISWGPSVNWIESGLKACIHITVHDLNGEALERNQGSNLSIKILFSLQEVGPLGHPESFTDDELHILAAFSLNHYLLRVGGADPLVHTKLT